MNDTHVYEMQVQMWKPNTWGVTAPMSKMLVDGGASINLMPYTTFCKLGKGPGDLIETDMMLKNFRGNASKTRRAINIELTILCH